MAASSLGACMFFRTLDDLSAGTSHAGAISDGASGADAAPPAEGGLLDGPPADSGAAGHCVVVDPSIARGEAPKLQRCFDYDDPDAGPSLRAESPATISVEPDDGPSPPNAVVARAPALPSSSANARHVVDVPLVARRVEMAFSVRVEPPSTQSGDYMQIASFFRDNVYTYLIYDPANAKLFFSEQDQRDGGLVNTTLSHGVVAVDLTQWHRVVFDLDFVGGRSSLRVVGGGATLDEPLQWPEVNWYGTAWLGTSFVYGTQAPLAMHFDDFALTVW